jgi:hypothetical protein
LLLPSKNPLLKRTLGKSVAISVHGRKFAFPRGEVVWIPVVNITVEELARVVTERIAKSLRKYPNVKKITVRVGETKEESARKERLLRGPQK